MKHILSAPLRRRLLCLLLAALLCLWGCGSAKGPQQYTATYFTLFDTVTTVVGVAPSQADFSARAQQVYEALLEYHRLFDIYHSYDGIANLKTVNDNAGIAPVKVDGRIIALLTDCLSYYGATGGTVNIAMGSVLRLWHDARTKGLSDPACAALPDAAALAEAGQHMSPEAIRVDPAASTVYITDPALQLDVGAVAKGWAVEQVCRATESGLLISVGGNVCATGPKDASGTPWTVAVQDPDGGDFLHTLAITGGSVVTSGDYQRAYTVDGRLYHHIIDPATLCPGTLWRSVTVVCPDSGAADMLSTALFLLPIDRGTALLEAFDAEAMWMDPQGTLHYSPGFRALLTDLPQQNN